VEVTVTTQLDLRRPSETTGSGAPEILRGRAWTPSAGGHDCASVEEVESQLTDPEARVWVDLESASEATLTGLASCLGLHPLIVEDIVERNQRAKIDITGDTMHLVMFALMYKGQLELIEVDIVIGSRFLLTSHPPDWRPTEMPNIGRAGVDHFLSEGTDYMLYAVVDAMVDGYFPVMDALGNQIDELEDEVVRRPSKPVVERLFRVRRELLEMRHTISPEREIFNQLTNREMPLIAPERIIYFRDVYDHLIRITDELDSYRELVSGALEAYLSTINNSLSEVMKRLTAVTAILAGVGAVAGIFGMSEAASAFNFREGLGFWLVTAFCLLLGGIAFAFFRRIGWI
jgi:magnesium transporter